MKACYKFLRVALASENLYTFYIMRVVYSANYKIIGDFKFNEKFIGICCVLESN